jgi:nucleoside-diphosphate-sugar epimerase
MSGDSAEQRTRLIIGCGYLGRRVARRWLDQGDRVWALTRTVANSKQLKSIGVEPIIGDVTQPKSLNALPTVDTVLHSIGFDRNAGPSKREVYVDGLRNVLNVVKERCQRFLYVSSTSVYGQQDGEVVDEDSTCEPSTESGQICLAAEELVEATQEGTNWGIVLRLAGIYGPERLLSRIESIREGLSLPGPKNAWLNLIHVDDVALVVEHIASAKAPPRLLLVSDDQPICRSQYYETLANCLDAPAPQFDETAIARHTRGINKRCSNSRLRHAGIELQFPTIETGLQHAVSPTVH